MNEIFQIMQEFPRNHVIRYNLSLDLSTTFLIKVVNALRNGN